MWAGELHAYQFSQAGRWVKGSGQVQGFLGDATNCRLNLQALLPMQPAF